MSVCISVSVHVWGKGQPAKNQLKCVAKKEQERDKDAVNLQTLSMPLGLLGSTSPRLIGKRGLRELSVPTLHSPGTRVLHARFWVNLSVF